MMIAVYKFNKNERYIKKGIRNGYVSLKNMYNRAEVIKYPIEMYGLDFIEYEIIRGGN